MQNSDNTNIVSNNKATFLEDIFLQIKNFENIISSEALPEYIKKNTVNTDNNQENIYKTEAIVKNILSKSKNISDLQIIDLIKTSDKLPINYIYKKDLDYTPRKSLSELVQNYASSIDFKDIEKLKNII